MTSSAVHHINFLCKDLKASADWMSRLLNQTPEMEQLSGRAVLTAKFNLGGAWLVLVQPTTEDSTVGQILKDRGEGLFLISLEVDDLEQTIVELDDKGIHMDDKGPRQGLDNWLVQDIATPECFGPVMQLCQVALKGNE